MKTDKKKNGGNGIMETKIKELEYAKKAVITCLKHDGTLVDMHNLEYWAIVVERLRKEIKDML